MLSFGRRTNMATIGSWLQILTAADPAMTARRTTDAKGHQVTSHHVPGFHGEDPHLATQPWRLSSEEPAPGPEAARRNRARRAVAAVLAATFVVLMPATVISAWIRGTVLSTSGYVAAVTPVAANPAIRAAVQDAVTTQVDAALKRAERSLPPAARLLAGPLSNGLADLAENRISEFTASPAFRRLWADVNRFAHSQLISVLNGDSALVPATGGQIVLNLVPLVNDVLHGIFGQLSSMTHGAVSLPFVSTIPAVACHVLPRASSPACAQVPLFPASALAGPRHVYRILVAVTWLVLVLTPLAFASALAASPRRRRTLLQMAIGGTLTLFAAGTVLSWLRSSLIARAGLRDQATTSVIVHALTNSAFTLTAWCVAGGFALAAVTASAARTSAGSELSVRQRWRSCQW
jgi:hypothetical protein